MQCYLVLYTSNTYQHTGIIIFFKIFLPLSKFRFLSKCSLFCYLRDFLPKLFRFSIYRGQLYFVPVTFIFSLKKCSLFSRRLFIQFIILCKTDEQGVSNLPLFCNNILQAVQLKVMQVVIIFYKHEQTDSSNGEINTKKNQFNSISNFPHTCICI